MYFARNVQFQIKNGKTEDFTRVFRTDVLPLLKQQKGFKEELTMLNKERGMGISLWENRTVAESYHNAIYPQVLQKLTPMIEGTPRVETYEVPLTTLGVSTS